MTEAHGKGIERATRVHENFIAKTAKRNTKELTEY
jgi:hypothetical protein